jgi:deoxyribose-phosphate aldolase
MIPVLVVRVRNINNATGPDQVGSFLRCMNQVSFPLASAIESTLLKVEATVEDIHRLCDEAAELALGAVCVPPYWVKEARRRLDTTHTLVVSVAGFPLGYSATTAKAEEIKRLVNDGCDEVDLVAPVTAIKNGHWSFVSNEINSLAQITHLKDRPLKLIIEMGMLSPEEIRETCRIAEEAKVDYIKTSTGMLAPGPSVEDIRFLRSILHTDTRIKASAGIRTRQLAMDLLAAGADRLGTSSAAAILAG